jgi:hypothetical protein
MEAPNSSETSIAVHHSTRYHNPENGNKMGICKPSSDEQIPYHFT